MKKLISIFTLALTIISLSSVILAPNAEAASTQTSVKVTSYPIYQLTNLKTGEQLLTADNNERSKFQITYGWKYEGVIGGTARTTDQVAVYRLRNTKTGIYFYTQSKAEVKELQASGWKKEGIAWQADKNGKTEIYKLVNKQMVYVYTNDVDEIEELTEEGYKNVGVLFDTSTSPKPAPLINQGITELSQFDPKWNKTKVGKWAFGKSGCVPTSFAMIANGYGIKRTPLEVGKWMHNNSNYNNKIFGANGKSIRQAAKHYKLTTKGIDSLEDAKKALKNNQAIIAQMDPPIAKEGGTHAVVLFGYDNGKTYLTDPAYPKNSGLWSVKSLYDKRSTYDFDKKDGYLFYAVYK